MTPDLYPEGYWERGEGSNYHGYGDDPGWEGIARILKNSLPPAAAVLELGCASGYFVRAARAHQLDCSGIDVSEYAVAKAPAEVKPFVVWGEATDVMFEHDGSRDAVVSWEMLEHLPEEDIQDTLAGIMSVLRPGGLTWHKIALNTDHDPNYPEIPFHDAKADVTHVSLWKPEEWRSVFEGYGFEHMPASEQMLNNRFRGRDWENRFFCYRKPLEA